MIKDAPLADAVAHVERSGDAPAATRAAVRNVVEERYTARA